MSDLGVPENVTEYFETSDKLAKQAKQLADMIKKAKHLVIFTGAGVSTSAKIPDFRGPKGVWTLRDQGKQAEMTITMEQAMPTLSHMSLVCLQDKGIMKYLISQNVDGLHRRSGIKPQFISELHGNCYIEMCKNCKQEYLRDFDVCDHAGKECKGYNASNSKSGIPHCTGRICDSCKGCLEDSIIHFKESLPAKALQLGVTHSEGADLHVVIGSSLTVSPACGLPLKTKKNGGKLVIMNLQKTSYDKYADLRIFGKCDEVMKLVMDELKLEIPKFQFIKKIWIGNTSKKINDDKYDWELFLKGDGGAKISSFVKKSRNYFA